MNTLTVEITAVGRDPILAPMGITTPQEAVTRLTVSGGRIAAVMPEPELGLGAALILPDNGPVLLHYTVAQAPPGAGYPAEAFHARDNCHTRAARDLVTASRAIAQAAGGGRAGIAALIAQAESRFAYAHPERKFTDGLDAVPYLSCGLTPGSCVDINTYLVASLRAAGYEAAYLYGYFFPAERGGMTDDGHCWVVTRHDGETLEWDIAHHLKTGLGPTRPRLNPRPGVRVALTHSMGHHYSLPDREVALKVLGEPMLIPAQGNPAWVTQKAHLKPELQEQAGQ